MKFVGEVGTVECEFVAIGFVIYPARENKTLPPNSRASQVRIIKVDLLPNRVKALRLRSERDSEVTVLALDDF